MALGAQDCLLEGCKSVCQKMEAGEKRHPCGCYGGESRPLRSFLLPCEPGLGSGHELSCWDSLFQPITSSAVEEQPEGPQLDTQCWLPPDLVVRGSVRGSGNLMPAQPACLSWEPQGP